MVSYWKKEMAAMIAVKSAIQSGNIVVHGEEPAQKTQPAKTYKQSNQTKKQTKTTLLGNTTTLLKSHVTSQQLTFLPCIKQPKF